MYNVISPDTRFAPALETGPRNKSKPHTLYGKGGAKTMKLSLGVKTDPVEHRYTYEWLFDLMAEAGATRVQLGSFFEMYFLNPDWFARLREKAGERGLRIQSMFTSYRELGGIMSDDPGFDRVARDCYRKMLDVAAALGVDYAGSNLGAVYYDRMDHREEGIRRSLGHLGEMAVLAGQKGLRGLAIEPMSCLAEPPTSPAECDRIMADLDTRRRAAPGAVPVYFCGDISHGYADADGRVVHDNWSFFEGQIPHMCEFHFKNTDAIFNSTFGFNAEERRRGIIDLARLRRLIDDNASRFPVDNVTGYLEMNHIKFGRDYTDNKVGTVLRDSLAALRDHFDFEA